MTNYVAGRTFYLEIFGCFRLTISDFLILNYEIVSYKTKPDSVKSYTVKELHPKQCGLCTWCLPVLTHGTEVLALEVNN